MLITRGDGLIWTAQAAEMVRADAATIRKWRQRGHLKPRGLDERGRPLYHPDDVAEAERTVTRNGVRASGVNPRTRRGVTKAAA